MHKCRINVNNVTLVIFCRGSADNITVVVINLKDRKFSVSEAKKNQLWSWQQTICFFILKFRKS